MLTVVVEEDMAGSARFKHALLRARREVEEVDRDKSHDLLSTRRHYADEMNEHNRHRESVSRPINNERICIPQLAREATGYDTRARYPQPVTRHPSPNQDGRLQNNKDGFPAAKFGRRVPECLAAG